MKSVLKKEQNFVVNRQPNKISWCKRWNKTIAQIFAAIVFFLLFLAVILATIKNETDTVDHTDVLWNSINAQVGLATMPIISENCFWKDYQNCKIICCNSKNKFEFMSVINSLHKHNNICISEIMDNINEGINKHLYTTSNVMIEIELIIDDTKELPNILSDLSGINQFIQKLIISNSSMLNLDNAAFNALKNLQSLRLDNFQNLTDIRAGILQTLSHHLKYLEVHELKSHSINLYNLTGSIMLPQLKNVSITNCLIPSIKHNAFLGLSNVSQMILVNCQIAHIDNGAFDAINATILSIDLSYNYLTKIDIMFSDWYLINPNLQINLTHNPIECYEMELFVEFMKSYSSMFIDDICRIYTSQIRSKPQIDDDVISCDGGHLTTIASSEELSSEEMFEWNVRTDSDGVVYIENMNIWQDNVLLWLLDDPFDKINSVTGCLYSSNIGFTIDNLEPARTYTFCTMPKDKSTVSPYNCLPYYHQFPKIIEPILWISIKDRALVIGMMILVYSCCIAFGLLIAYCILKRYPTLLKGGNGVVVVRNSTDFAPKEIPERCDEDYLDVKSEYKSMYEEAVNPSRFDIVKWQIDNNKTQDNTKSGNYYYSEAYRPPPAPAPPLPLQNTASCSIILNDRFSSTSTDELLKNERGGCLNGNDSKKLGDEDDNIYATYNEAINNTYI